MASVSSVFRSWCRAPPEDDAATASSSGGALVDAAPSASGDARAASPCSAGGTRWVTLQGKEGGGELVAFGDCFDAGGIPPVVREAGCEVFSNWGLEPERVTRTFLDHGGVTAAQAAPGLAVSVAGTDARAPFTTSIASGKPVRFDLGAGAALPAERIDVVAGQAVAFTAPSAAVARAQGFTLTWQSGKAGETVDLSVRSGEPGSGVLLRCAADAGAGTLVVPAAVLSKLAAGTFPLEVVTRTSADGPSGTTAWVRVAGTATGASSITLE